MKARHLRAGVVSPVGGFTMIEVLISIVVITFGMLGIAGLQAYALKNSQSASLRSVATVLASDMIDRMKANPLGATDGNYDEGSAASSSASVPSCLSTGCGSPKNLASNDLFEWKTAVSESLPNASAIVCLDDKIDPDSGKSAGDTSICSHTGTQYVIYIWWRDDRNRGSTAGAVSRFATQFHI